MKFLDRLISFIFDLAVLVIAVVVLLVTLNFVDYGVIDGLIREYVLNEAYNTIVIVSAVIVILAFLKITIFSSTLSSRAKKNISVNTEHGKIQISQETLEGIAKSVVSAYPEIKDVQARMTKANRGINMYTVIGVYPNASIKEVVTKAQNDIKRNIELKTGVPVKNIDVKIKSVNNTNSAKEVKKSNIVTNVESDVNTTENNAVSSQETIVAGEKVDYVAKPASEEYLRDEENVLYKVKPNPDAEEKH